MTFWGEAIADQYKPELKSAEIKRLLEIINLPGLKSLTPKELNLYCDTLSWIITDGSPLTATTIEYLKYIEEKRNNDKLESSKTSKTN